MGSDFIRHGQTFIEQARRRQLVDSAIEIIARRGLSHASLAWIARHAGCSKGVISYHFDGKRDLLEAVLQRLIHEPLEFVQQRVDRCDRAPAKLDAYVTAHFEFMRSHPDHYRVLVDLRGTRGGEQGCSRLGAEIYEPARGFLSKILRAGQDSGEFLKRPLLPTATAIHGMIDGVMLQWICAPETIDLESSGVVTVAMIRAYVSSHRRGR